MLYKEAKTESEMKMLLESGYELVNLNTINGCVTYVMKESTKASKGNMLLG